MTKVPKRSLPRVPSAGLAELVLVVDVSAFTDKGFVGTTRYEGRVVDFEFDDGDAGVSLSSEMAGRLHVRKGSRLSLAVEDESNQTVDSRVASTGKSLRISSAKVYYAVGRGGGAVIRIRKT